MKKKDIIEEISKKTGLSKAASGKALNAILDSIKKELKKEGDRVTLVGFGTFSIAKRKARKGINPQTKEKIKIRAKKVVKFKPGKGITASTGPGESDDTGFHEEE